MSAEVSKLLVDTVRAALVKHTASKSGAGKPVLKDAATLEEVLPPTFVALDEDLYARVREHMTLEDSGTTAVCVFVTPTHVVCANTGDSRAIFVSGGKTTPLSFDHKPSNTKERERIYAAGGVVSMDRVDSDLAVSRAFGDTRFKENKHVAWNRQKVSPEPDVVTVARDAASDQYVVVACDGLWDVLTNDEMGAMVLELGRQGASPAAAAEFLIDECLRRGSKDNMSVIVTALEAAPKPPAGKVAAFEAARARADAARRSLQERGGTMEAGVAYAETLSSFLAGDASAPHDDDDDAAAAPGDASSSSSGPSA